ncbi:MAG: hypothetical protein Q4D02_08460 [Clostridia bacterium]|nr:hypothetical protein [Clostridia bacterium]
MTYTKKITKKILAMALAMIMLFTINTSQAYASGSVTPSLGPYRLEYGISHVNYYITDSVLNHPMGSTLVTLINNAANSWVDTGYGWNPLYMYRSYDLYNSNMDFYLREGYVEGFIRGNITYWNGNSANPVQTYPHQSNWVYSEITLFITMFDQNDLNSIQRAIAYFMGSGFGLATTQDPNSVMCSFYTKCNVYKPGIMDHNGLNAMYNN